MSLQAIPNQPIGFVPTRLQGALCGADPTEQLLVADGDIITFQFGYTTCENAGEIGDPTFDDPDQWRNLGGWEFGESQVCKEGGSNALAIQYTGWSPSIGTLYQLVVNVTSLQGLSTEVNYLMWELGGSQGFIFAAGQYIFTIDATTTQRLQFTASSAGMAVCIDLAQVTVLDAANDITIVDLDDNVVATFTYDDDPQVFDYSGGYMTANFLADADWGSCWRIRVDDPCAEVEYTSQQVNLVNQSETILITTCNASPGMGFGQGFTPRGRYQAKLVRSTFSYNEEVERGTNGYVNNYYVERLRSMELRIDDAGEVANNFLSTLPLYDHVYLGQEEYRVKGDGYEPDYGDVWEAHGNVVLSVEPKQEAMRKVRCLPDVAMGCAPPPNYLVQGTGPNEDYIVLQTGGRIKLH